LAHKSAKRVLAHKSAERVLAQMSPPSTTF
jgi:hypothetical protein